MPKTNLRNQASQTIRHRIVTCEYAPGAFINEELLTTELHLSRTPIRDALSRLEQEGLVRIMPKRGIIVTPLSVTDINLIFEIRFLYEPYILRTYGSLLSEQKLMEFYNIFLHKDSDHEFFKNSDYFYSLDSEFHSMIVNACPNFYLCDNYHRIQTQDQRFRYMSGSFSTHRMEETCLEHLDILACCLQKNWADAAEKMVFHLEESKKATFQLIFDKMK